MTGDAPAGHWPDLLPALRVSALPRDRLSSARRHAEAAWRDLRVRVVRKPQAPNWESPPWEAGYRRTCGAFCRLPSF